MASIKVCIRIICQSFVMLFCLSQTFSALNGAEMNSRDPEHTWDDTARMFLVTMFMGDEKQTVSYLTELKDLYQRVLTRFVSDDYCKKSAYGNDALEACLFFLKTEEQAIRKGDWTKPFQFHLADITQNYGRNIGTYRFIRDVDLVPEYTCSFTMQITKILNIPEFPMSEEITFECE